MADSEAKVHVVNRALVKIGEPASFTIDANTALGGKIDLVWPGVEARVYATYDWADARQTFSLEAISGATGLGWSYGFLLPATRIGQPLAILTDVVRECYLRDFMIEGGKIYTNVTPVWARCRVAADPETWDEGFKEAFAIALASALAVPLTQDEQMRDTLAAQAFGDPREQGGGGLFGKLSQIDRAAQPQGRGFMDNDPLTAARFG
jgi:hypothetical protein